MNPNEFEKEFTQAQLVGKLLQVTNLTTLVSPTFFGQTMLAEGVVLWQTDQFGFPTAHNSFILYSDWHKYLFNFVDSPLPFPVIWEVKGNVFFQSFEARICLVEPVTQEISLKLVVEPINDGSHRYGYVVTGNIPQMQIDDHLRYINLSESLSLVGLLHTELENIGNAIIHYMTKASYKTDNLSFISSYNVLKSVMEFAEITNQIVDDLVTWHKLNPTQESLLSQLIQLYFAFGENMTELVLSEEHEYDFYKLIERGILFEDGKFDPSCHIDVPPSKNLPFTPFSF